MEELVEYIQERDKQTTEKLLQTVDYGSKTPTGVVASIFNLDSQALTNAMLNSTTAVIIGNTATVLISDGVDGNEYRVSFLATFADGQKWKDDVLLRVNDI